MSKITDLPEATSLDGSETVPIVKGGATQRTTLSSLVESVAQPFVDASKDWADSAAVIAAANKIPPLRQASYSNAVRNRFTASFAGQLITGQNGTSPALGLAFEDAPWNDFGEFAVLRMTDTVNAGAQPKFTVPITPADLALVGLIPSDSTPPRFSARAAIQRATLINQTIDGAKFANGQWYVIARYNGAGASLAGPVNAATDVVWIGDSTGPNALGAGSADVVWTGAGSTGTYTLTANEKILIRNNVPLRATYGGKDFSGLILFFFGQAPANGAVGLSVGRMAVIPGATISPTAQYMNLPEDAVSLVDRRNLSAGLLALIDGAATETSVVSRLAAKQEYVPPLKPASILNAVRRRYGATASLPGPHGAVAGGVTSPAATNVYSDRFWTNYGEPSAMRVSGTSTASAQNGPRSAYYISLDDLASRGITPDDTTPPLMDFAGAIDLAASVAQNITNAAQTNGQFWVCLRYNGIGAALEGTTYSSATDVIFTNNGSGATVNGIGIGDAAWSGSTGTVAWSAAEKFWTRKNVPIRATYAGKALTGILIVFFGTTSAASGATSIVTGRLAAVPAGSSDFARAVLNTPEDYSTSSANSAASYVDNNYIYDAATGTSLLTSSSLTPPTAGVDYLFLVYGQSWALADNPSGAPLLTTTAQHPSKALMPASGVAPSGAFTSYANLVEAGPRETVCGGLADVIMTRLNARVGAKPRAIFAVCAMGGQAIAGGSSSAGSDIGVGSDTFERAISIVQSAYNTSKQAGRQLVVGAIVWMQGEQDFNDALPRWLYKRGLIRMRQAFDAKIAEITGQKDPVMMYTYLTNRGYSTAFQSNEVALAQLEATKDDPFIRTFGPVYWCPDAGDGSHSTPTGYRGMGNQAGNAIVEDLFGPYWEPLRVVEAYWSATNKFCLRYTMPLAIESTDALVTVSTLGAGKGIQFDDGSGSPPTITGIAIKSGTTDTVEVTLSAAPTGPRRRYWIAMRTTGANTGAVTGARSGIRSSASYWTDSLTGLTMYHWACPEEGVL